MLKMTTECVYVLYITFMSNRWEMTLILLPAVTCKNIDVCVSGINQTDITMNQISVNPQSVYFITPRMSV